MRTLGKLFLGLVLFITLVMALGTVSNRPNRSTASRPTAAPPPAPPPGANWLNLDTEDSMTSQKGVTLATVSTNKVAGRFGRQLPASLFLVCRNNKTELYIDVDDFISNQPVPVMSRVDEKPPQTREWGISTDFESVFAPQPIALARELSSAKRFQIRLTPHGDSPRTYEFDVTGLDLHLPKLQSACNWR